MCNRLLLLRVELESMQVGALQARANTAKIDKEAMAAALRADAPVGALVALIMEHVATLAAKINRTPSLYLEAGAIHGTVLCQGDRPLVYMEDVGRHNAVDKIAGYIRLNGVPADDKILYTTGRLPSEMVIKTVHMGIPILVSRSGFTAWGVELAREANLTLIGRARGRRFMALAGEGRITFDADAGDDPQDEGVSRRGAA